MGYIVAIFLWIVGIFAAAIGGFLTICAKKNSVSTQYPVPFLFSLLLGIGFLILGSVAVYFAAILGDLGSQLAWIVVLCVLLFSAILGICSCFNAEDKVAKVILWVFIIAVVAIVVMLIGAVIECINAPEEGYSGTNSGGGAIYEECYVCGGQADIKYGEYYYCATHYGYVKTVVDAEY